MVKPYYNEMKCLLLKFGGLNYRQVSIQSENLTVSVSYESFCVNDR